MSQTPFSKQQLAGMVLFVFALGLVVLFLTLVTGSMLMGWLRGDGGVGEIVLLLMQSDMFHTLIKALLFILAFGASIVAGPNADNRVFALVIGLAALGIIACMAILLGFSSGRVARPLFMNSLVEGITSYDEFKSAIKKTFLPLALWLVGIIGVQLGLRGQQKEQTP